MSGEIQIASTQNSNDNQMSNGDGNVSVGIEDSVGNLSNTTRSKPKIFEVDARLRLVNENDYEPKILAIGPIHARKRQLQQMQQHKERYLEQLLQRKPGLRRDELVEKLKAIKVNALQCYSTSLNLDADEFVQMMLLDGCFLIQLMKKHFFNKSTEEHHIFENETRSQMIIHDLMLFENQLPFPVLNKLFDETKTEDPDDNLCRLVKFLVEDMLPWLNAVDPSSNQNSHPTPHLLGLIHQWFTPFSPKIPTKTAEKDGRYSSSHINSASELKEAGICLKQSKRNNGITFKGRVLELPLLKVSGETESLLRNLMAYEQLSLDDDRPRHVTDYVFFMHCLIRSTKDIELLRRRGIINNFIGGDDNIYQMFDGLGTNVLRSSDSCYSDVFVSLNKHCGRRHKRWIAKLMRRYFNSPWSIIKFLAATLLLGLAMIQTVFTVLAFYKRNDVMRMRLT